MVGLQLAECPVDVLASPINFASLSLKDLLEARDLYHWQLSNKRNVLGTAVGLYLIRKSEETVKPTPPNRLGIRTFENSEVRPHSWPCVVVLVHDWIDATTFGSDGIDPDHLVPRTLFLPDGRAMPVCVVAVEPASPLPAAPADVRWPDSYIGGGCPVVAEVQGIEKRASIGCLVTDGHKTYALTNRHVTGDPGAILKALARGNLVEIGRTSNKQLTRKPFTAVFPEFPGRRTYLTLDIGLIEVANVDDWRSQTFGITENVGDVADLNELNLGLQLIDQPVQAFGAHSGALEGKIKALLYRHKSMAGYDFVSEFLIAPSERTAQTSPGDSGTVWHLRTTSDLDGKAPLLRPMAVEWGGQTVLGSGGKHFNFALATGLSTVCQLLDVDLVRDHNTGPNPYWGQTGHYSIASDAIDAVQNPLLKSLLLANIDRISFRPDQLTPEEIRAKLANGDFVELADVPDLVWKKTPDRVPGGRDYAQSIGPEHPTHYADIDEPGTNGQTLRDLTLTNLNNMDVTVWEQWYVQNGKTHVLSQGLLPFRVWQFFKEMMAQLQAGDMARFICAAGIMSHFVGDACQPLHGSYFSNGYKDPNDPDAKNWPGKGVHSTYEDKMVDRFSSELLAGIGAEAATFPGPIPPIADGRDAAFATVTLMSQVAAILPPKVLCDVYIRLGGGNSAAVVEGLWKAVPNEDGEGTIGDRTAKVMGMGARYLAAIWDAAFTAAHATLPGQPAAISEATLASIYKDPTFVPSLTLNKIGAVLGR
jgi:hypothetical protein